MNKKEDSTKQKPENKKPKTKRMKKNKFFVYVFGLISFGFILNILIDNPYSHQIIQTIIKKEIANRTPIEYKMQAISVSLFPPSAALYGVELFIEKTPEGNQTSTKDKQLKKITSIDHIRIGLDLFNSILGEPKVSSIEVNGPKFFLYPDTVESLANLKDPNEVNQEEDSFELNSMLGSIYKYVSNVSIEQLQFFLMIDQKTNPNNGKEHIPQWLEIFLSGGKLNAKFYKNKIITSLDIDSMDLIDDEFPLLAGTKIDGKVNWEKDYFAIEELKLNGPRIDLSIFGKLPPNPDAIDLIDINGKGWADLSILGSYLQISDTLGKIQIEDLNFQMLGDSEKTYWTIKSKVTSNYLMLDGYRLTELESNVTISKGGILFENLSALNKRLQGNFKLGFGNEIPFSLSAAVNDLPFGFLMDILGINFDFMDGRLESKNITLKGTGSPFQMKISSTSELKNLKFPSLQPEKPFYLPDCALAIDVYLNKSMLDFKKSNAICKRTGKEIELENLKPQNSERDKSQEEKDLLRIRGEINFQPFSVNMQLKNNNFDFSLVNNITQFDMGGFGPTIVEIKSNELSTIVSGKTKLKNFSFNKLVSKEAQSQFEYSTEAGSLKLNNLNIKTSEKGSIIVPEGQIDFSPLSFKLNTKFVGVEREFVKDFYQKFGIDSPCNFKISSARAILDGDPRSIRTFKASGSVVAHKVHCNENLVSDYLSLNTNLNTKALYVNNFFAKKNDLELLGKGIINFFKKTDDLLEAKTTSKDELFFGVKKRDRLSVQISTKVGKRGWSPYEHIATSRANAKDIPFIGEFLRESDIEGNVLVKASLTGAIENLQGTVKGLIQNTSILNNQIPPIRVKGFFENNQLNLTLNHSGQSLVGRWDMDFSKEGVPYEWYFKFDKTDLRFITPKFFFNDPRNFIYFSGNWHMKGTLSNWWKSEGEAEIDTVWGKLVRDVGSIPEHLNFKSEYPVTIKISKNGWNSMGKPFRIKSEDIDFEAWLENNRLPEKIGLKSRAIVDLKTLKKYSEQVENASGSIELNVDTYGSLSDPKLRMVVKKPDANTSQDGRILNLGLTTLRPALKDIDLYATYENGLINVNRFSAKKGEGTVDISGIINLLGSSNLNSNLNISARNASFVYEVPYLKEFDTRLNGELVLSGSKMPFVLSGNIDIERARANHSFDIRNEIVDAIRKSSIELSNTATDPILNFNINLNANKSIQISNRSVQALTSINLLLRGTEKKPEITGQILVDRGKIIYKSDFIIERGIISFDDPLKIDPNLDVEAYAQIPPYRININITGKASRPSVNLSVDPPTREDGTPISQVETLILLSRGELPKQDSTKADLEGTVTTEALNLVVSQFETPLEKFLSLTGQEGVEIYLDTYPSQVDGSTQVRLNMPINIYENFDVILRMASSEQGATVEYPIHDSISTAVNYSLTTDESESNQDDNKALSLDLKFDFAFP